MSDIYLSLTETPSVVTLSQPVVASVMVNTVTVANVVSVNVVTMPAITVQAAAPSVTTVAGTVTIGSCVTHGVNVANSVTISSLPAISGTVTANLPITEPWAGIYDSGNDCIKIELANLNGDTLSPSNPLPISGTVTANVPLVSTDLSGGVTQGIPVYLAGGKDGVVLDEINYVNNVLSLPAISGTVTANNPNGTLTTRFGSVTTANTAQLTSAVTNTSRKYLLVQNIATSTVTIGIGFAPTTTQGIQLTAGAGLTFDAFCPTGGVWWLSGVTSSNICVIEG